MSPRAIKVYDGVTGTYIKDFSSTGALDFTFDAGGNMYAVDNANVKKYDVGGNLLRAYTDGVSTPEGIALSPQGHLLVTNTYDGAYRNTVTDLDPSNGSFTTFATGLGEPVGIIAGPDGRYYLANSTFANSYGGANPDTIQVVGASGGASSTWNRGGGLYGASYLAFAGNQLFVTSFLNGTVQVFDGTTGASLGAFAASSYPLGIAYRAAPVPESPALVLSAIGVFAVLPWAHRRPKARGRAAT